MVEALSITLSPREIIDISCHIIVADISTYFAFNTVLKL